MKSVTSLLKDTTHIHILKLTKNENGKTKEQPCNKATSKTEDKGGEKKDSPLTLYTGRPGAGERKRRLGLIPLCVPNIHRLLCFVHPHKRRFGNFD